MFMCVVNLKLVNKLDLTWKQSFLILRCLIGIRVHLFLFQLRLQNRSTKPLVLSTRSNHFYSLLFI
jgi:hypothetical protein